MTWATGAIAGCNAISGIEDFTAQSEAGDTQADATADHALPPGHGRQDDGRPDASATQGDSTPSEVGDDAPLDGLADASDATRGGDAADAPNDGMATCGSRTCSTPFCCDGGCATAHANGLGQFFYDCMPPSTFDVTQAFGACVAFTGKMSECTNDPITCGGGDQVCSSGASMCACWRYNGTSPGHVLNTGATCQCLGSNSPTWN
jgi:hypothetical protein